MEPPRTVAASEPGPPPKWAGRWLFVPAPGTAPGAYPAEYIELRLSESGEMLRGAYQARYRIADRAISPNVAFQFEGRAGAEGAVLPWRGPGGAVGEITLRLLPAGTLEVAWVAEKLGGELGLISGRATLVRKIE